LQSFTENKDDYVGVIFRYIKIKNDEEFYLFKIKKSSCELIKYVNNGEDVLGEYEYNFNLIDEKNPGF
jgi:hypothetical protein